MLEDIDYLSIIFSVVGAVIFLYCIYLSWKIIKLFPKNSKTLKYWYAAIALIIMFFFGYVFNIAIILMEDAFLQQMMTSMVYILGALFVLVVTFVSYKTYKIILQ
ncbi:MAG: hypothetical protein HeimC3_34980 [Candidatus Heimdallarchaeota archaeon LC_3]|nr:MAG: hypothetical protein HeimC3_34980 [Candidatus Heimdallarchaeota archaeon LC_3]